MSVGSDLKRMIGTHVWMTLGASDFTELYGDNPGLRLKARILPFRKDGKRSSRPRVMTIEIRYFTEDMVDLKVIYPETKTYDIVEHFSAHGIPLRNLGTFLFALDYDGPEVLNPRVIKRF